MAHSCRGCSPDLPPSPSSHWSPAGSWSRMPSPACAARRSRSRGLFRAGLRAFCADLLMAAVAAMLVTVAAMLGVVVGAIGLLLLSPLLVYVLLRLEFWMLAIFDGEGIAGGFNRSWRLTRGAVLRVFGWALVVGLIGLLLSAGLFALDLLLARAPVCPGRDQRHAGDDAPGLHDGRDGGPVREPARPEPSTASAAPSCAGVAVRSAAASPAAVLARRLTPGRRRGRSLSGPSPPAASRRARPARRCRRRPGPGRPRAPTRR